MDVVKHYFGSEKQSPDRDTSKKILLYVPNLIGYARIAMTICLILFYKSSPVLCTLSYSIGFILDAADGEAARRLNQTSRFGAVLDMVTDRFSTAALASILCMLYPDWSLLFILMNILDFVSHWFRMYSSLFLASNSHKNANPLHPRLLNVYYTDKKVMAVLCVGNEFFYIALYLHYFVQFGLLMKLFFWLVLVPTWAGKQLMNVLQMNAAAMDITEHEYGTDAHHKQQ